MSGECNKTHIAKKGDSVFGPRMIPHSFAKNGEEVGKLLIVFQPAGKMEDCFKKMSEGHTNNLSKEERSSFFKEHGLELV